MKPTEEQMKDILSTSPIASLASYIGVSKKTLIKIRIMLIKETYNEYKMYDVTANRLYHFMQSYEFEDGRSFWKWDKDEPVIIR